MPQIAAAIGAAVIADEAVIDGILTDEATHTGAGVASIPESKSTVVRMLVRQEADVEVEAKDVRVDPVEAFVALDLLRLDGQSLLDVPLLERKRLLESVIEQGDLVRVSVHARPPVEAWVASWKGAGLKGAMLKAANSRYVPGSSSPEWRAVTQVAGRR